MLERVRLVLDVIGLVSVVLGAVAPVFPAGSTRRRVAVALGAVVPEALRAMRDRWKS